MSRGTWQGSGTWQTSGPDLGDVGLIFAAVAAAGVVVEVVLSIIVWIAVALGIASALAVAGLIWWLRGKPAREARFAAAIAAQRQAPALTATAVPLPADRREAPAIEPPRELHVHFHGLTSDQIAAVITQIGAYLEENR